MPYALIIISEIDIFFTVNLYVNEVFLNKIHTIDQSMILLHCFIENLALGKSALQLNPLVIMKIRQIVLWMGENQIYQNWVESVRRHQTENQRQCGGWTSEQCKVYTT